MKYSMLSGKRTHNMNEETKADRVYKSLYITFQ